MPWARGSHAMVLGCSGAPDIRHVCDSQGVSLALESARRAQDGHAARSALSRAFMNSVSVTLLSPLLSIAWNSVRNASVSTCSSSSGDSASPSSQCSSSSSSGGSTSSFASVATPDTESLRSESMLRLHIIIMAVRSSSLGSTPVSQIMRPSLSTGSWASTAMAKSTWARKPSSRGTYSPSPACRCKDMSTNTRSRTNSRLATIDLPPGRSGSARPKVAYVASVPSVIVQPASMARLAAKLSTSLAS
mmetsp:Transcript_2675/g.8941  ORF Transcript_2675/g.8941 Transcript_2675/m.8941 type:complete len:247 (+) Transcript_2675:159-899(+)